MTNEVVRARGRLAGLFTYGRTPDPEVEAEARRSLQVAKLDRAIRDASTAAPPLDAVRMGHLVGLLLSWGGSDENAVARLERAVKEAFYVTPVATAEDRERIAKIITAGGAE